MRVLLVEDEADVSSAIQDALAARGFAAELEIVTNRNAAVEAVCGDEHYDIVVCDLRIPSSAGALDDQTDYGREVYATARAQRPGVPVWVFSAYSDADFLDYLLGDQSLGDPFGAGVATQMVRHFRKIRLSDLIDELGDVSREVDELSRIEISTGGETLHLAFGAERMLRVTTRYLHGTTARVRQLTGGYTDAQTLQLEVVDQHGATVARGVVKLGSRAELEEEVERYEANVPIALPAMGFAPLAKSFPSGTARHMSVLYTIAGENLQSLARLLADDEGRSIEVVGRIRRNLAPWEGGAHTDQLNLTQICELLSAPSVIDDNPLNLEASLHQNLAALQIQVRIARQHGDLHLGNVLVEAAATPVLIDYGRTGVRLASHDPVTLELCLAFHPDMRQLCAGWPTGAHAGRFEVLDEYLLDCPFPDFVKTCRTWAHDVANGDREVWASVLAYALRQLNFSDTDHGLARAYALRAAQLLADSLRR